ncbi:MAG TPA: hypothetical protein VNN79_12995, partial [Actinomycetota bacterium]|nr:hypothetical protein [Actinomycetota bacterium]
MATEAAPLETEAAPPVDPARALAKASLVPAFLAAVAEAGLVFLPVELIGRTSTLHATGGPLAWYPLFLVLFSGGVAIGARLRGRAGVPYGIAAGCVVVGIVQSVAWNAGGGTGAFIAISLCLLAGIRMVTLALRDWRDPIDASFGWGAGVLLAEIVIAHVAEWGDVVWPIAVLFFLGSLGSRAASVRMVERSVQGAAAGPDSARRWRIVAATLGGGAVLLTGVGLVLGTQSGPIDRLAQLLVQALAALIYWAAYLIAVVLNWILSVVGLDRNGIQEFISRIGRRLQRNLGRHDAAGGAP